MLKTKLNWIYCYFNLRWWGDIIIIEVAQTVKRKLSEIKDACLHDRY